MRSEDRVAESGKRGINRTVRFGESDSFFLPLGSGSGAGWGKRRWRWMDYGVVVVVVAVMGE